MNPIKAIIIEDELPSARMLKHLLQQMNIEVLASLPSVEESISWLKNNSENIDLIFSDIRLSDGLCFDIFRTVSVQSTIIFITAYNHYAMEAFEFNSIGYLLKPLEKKDLEKIIQKYRRQNLSVSTNINWEELTEILTEKNYKTRFLIKVGTHLKSISITDIECLYSQNKATYIFTTSGRSYLLDQNLEYWSAHLNPKLFFRVNRQYIICINAITDMVSYTNSRWKVVLKKYNKESIIVARDRAKNFKKWLEQ